MFEQIVRKMIHFWKNENLYISGWNHVSYSFENYENRFRGHTWKSRNLSNLTLPAASISLNSSSNLGFLWFSKWLSTSSELIDALLKCIILHWNCICLRNLTREQKQETLRSSSSQTCAIWCTRGRQFELCLIFHNFKSGLKFTFRNFLKHILFFPIFYVIFSRGVSTLTKILISTFTEKVHRLGPV